MRRVTLKPTTKYYIRHLTLMQYQEEKAKGSGATLRDCLMMVLEKLNYKVVTNV